MFDLTAWSSIVWAPSPVAGDRWITQRLRKFTQSLTRLDQALVNAARHGSATRAHVTIRPAGDGKLTLSIADNGCGFPFSGRYSADDLAAMNAGPKTLRERVSAINGSLELESSPAGAELNVVLPLVAAA
jgi:signal transduction histidine kinase